MAMWAWELLHLLVIAMPPLDSLPWNNMPVSTVALAQHTRRCRHFEPAFALVRLRVHGTSSIEYLHSTNLRRPCRLFPLLQVMEMVYQFLLPATLLPRPAIVGISAYRYPATAFFAGYASVLALLVSSCALVAFGFYSDPKSWKPRQFVISLLRFGTRLILSCLVPSISAVLVSSFNCAAGDDWYGSGITCFGGAHIGVMVASIAVIVTTFPWLFLLSATMVDRTPDPTGKKNLLCASHGRVDAGMFVVKLILGIMYAFGGGINAVAYGIIVLLLGLAYVSTHIFQLHGCDADVDVAWCEARGCARSTYLILD